VDILALKLVATPLLILAASLAGRRWGETVGGWLVGLPLTSGPVCFFLALEQGPGFAAATGLGSLAGAASETAFCLAYGVAARRAPWPLALLAASLAYGLAAVLFALAALPLWKLLAAVVAALTVALSLLPNFAVAAVTLPAPPRWELPARMAVATALVFGLTELAPYAGPQASGLLATYPVFAAVLTVFAHHRRGPAAAMGVMRGLLMGLFSFAGFFAVLAPTLQALGIPAAFAAAIAACLAIQGGSLWLLRRRLRRPES
jgi:hypothetical protein